MGARLANGRTQPIDYTPFSAVSAGDVVVLENNAFMAKRDIAAGQLGELHAYGVWDMPKETGVAHSAGDLVYWNASEEYLTKTAADNTKWGICIADAAEGATEGRYLHIPVAE